MGAERGHLHAGLGSWTRRGRGGRRPGARLPLLARGSGGWGGLSQAGPGRGEHSFSHGLYGEPQEPPLGLRAGVAGPPFASGLIIASSRGRPCPPGRLPAWVSTWRQERAGAQAGKGGGVGGAESGEPGSGRGEPARVYTPSSLGAGPPDSLGELQRSRGCVRGRVPLGRAGAGAGPLQNCVLGALLGLGDWAPSPEGRRAGGPGRGRGGSAAASSRAESRSRVSLCSAVGAQLRRDPLRGLSEDWGCFWGPRASPGWRREGLSG